MRLFVLCLALFGAVQSALAQEKPEADDPIAAKLTQAKEAYQAAVEKAKERLVYFR